MPPRPNADHVIAVAGELRLALRRIVRRLREEAPDEGLTASQRRLLVQLDALGPSTTSTLARAEAVRVQSMSATVAAVEAAGLVARRPHETDGRRQIIALTGAGETALADSRARRQEWLETAMLEQLSREEVATIREAAAILERLAQY